jgi:hypothetical protein
VGTADPIHDALEQQRLNLSKVYRPDGTLVYGELMTFDDPDVRLPALDCLDPREPTCPTDAGHPEPGTKTLVCETS